MTRVGTVLMVPLMGIGGTREPFPSILKGKCRHFRHCPKSNDSAKMQQRAKHHLSHSGTRTWGRVVAKQRMPCPRTGEDGNCSMARGRRRRGAPQPRLSSLEIYRSRCLTRTVAACPPTLCNGAELLI
jgi:hypothetical protein